MRNNLAQTVNSVFVPPFGSNLIENTEPDPPGLTELVRACEDGKGIDIKTFDVRKRFGLADSFIVVSGRSDRHVQGIAYRLMKLFEDRGLEPYSVQGLQQGQWVVVDATDVIVHIFYEPLRAHYDLDGLWDDSVKYQNVK